MAKVTDVFVKGTVENLVFYRRMGTNCSRIKRPNIQQSGPTKIRGINFGIASRAGKGLRSGLTPIMPLPTDRSMQSRFCGAIAKWLGLSDAGAMPPCDAAPYISSFQFTGGADFNARFKPAMMVSQAADNNITVSIDAFVPVLKIAAPTGTTSVKLTVTVAGCILKTGEPAGSTTQSITIPYNNDEIAAQILSFTIPILPGSFTITAARLQYNDSINILNMYKPVNIAWLPAGVVNARYNK